MTNSPSHCSFPRSSSFYRIRLYQAEEVSVLEILVCQLIKRLQNTSPLVLRNPFEAPALALAVLAGCPDQYRLAGAGRGVLFTLCPLSLRNGSRPRFRLPRALSWMFGSVCRAVRGRAVSAARSVRATVASMQSPLQIAWYVCSLKCKLIVTVVCYYGMLLWAII